MQLNQERNSPLRSLTAQVAPCMPGKEAAFKAQSSLQDFLSQWMAEGQSKLGSE